MTEEEKLLLANVGGTLLVVQATEELFHFVLKFCLQADDEGLTFENLERADSQLKKKTLGQFLHLLRARVDLDDTFDQVLGTFLENRNILAHRLGEAPGWDLKTPEGRAAGAAFLNDTAKKAVLIANVLTGLIRAWSKQVGIEVELSDAQKELLQKIDAVYTPAVDSIFFKKSNNILG